MRKVLCSIIFVLILAITSITARAQVVSSLGQTSETDEIPTSVFTEYRLDTLARNYVYFRHDVDWIDTNYSDNRASLASIRKALTEIEADSVKSISSIIVEGSSSPLGHPYYNLMLSYKRAQTVGKFLHSLPGLKDFDGSVAKVCVSINK